MAYSIGIDVGGTFTDFLLADAYGNFTVYKVSTTPHNPSEGVFDGLAAMAADKGLSLEQFIGRVEIIVHGTTVTTNAVLTGSGAKTALLTTEGFRDALQMRRGIREEQYNNRYLAPPPLVPRDRCCPVKERVTVSGEVLTELEVKSFKENLQFLKEEQVEAIAVCFLHAYANDGNEKKAKTLIRKYLPGVYLTISSELLPQVRFYDRLSTTVLNSYVGPILQDYLENLARRLDDSGFQGVLLIMQSNGGVTSPRDASRNAACTLLSGPSAGPVAGIAYADTHKFPDCITIDMGGTSFDVALVKERRPLVITDGSINRYRSSVPMVAIHTIGAGGGSIGWIDDMGLLRMGPQSAGAIPGPACYRRGGNEPTCTDANLLLGYLNKDYFLGGKMPLDFKAAWEAIGEKLARPLGIEEIDVAAGMFSIINANMADGIREVSVRKGFDPREFPLVVAGGAGPIHAGMIALELEIPTILIPRESSIFCAAGMLLSDLRHDYVRSLNTLLSHLPAGDLAAIQELFKAMKEEGHRQLLAEGIRAENIEHTFSGDMRYLGQYHEINVCFTEEEIMIGDMAQVCRRFHHDHDRLYGYSLEGEGAAVELVNLRVSSLGITDKPRFRNCCLAGDGGAALRGRRPVYLPDRKDFRDVDVWDGDRLPQGTKLNGPAIIEQVNTTIFVPPQYELELDEFGNFIMQLGGAACARG
ncbi:MAG: hydantoinase/oxoprolinase family protein [Bacillota bacterium]